MKQNIPKRRFKEFINSGEWEEKKLGEVANYRRGSFPQPYGKKEWYGGVGSKPFVQVVDVDSNLKLVDETKQKISIVAQPKSVFVIKGTVIVTLQGSIGRVAITQYNSYVDRTILIFESYNEKIAKKFWAYIIRKKFEEEKKSAPGATIKTITISALSHFIVNIPSKPEQEKIGKFFEKLDRLIDLNREKLEKLKNIKSAYLSEMFPKEGELYPKRRFSGFTEPWEEKKLGDVAIFNPKENLPKKFKYIDLESVLGTKLISYREEYIETAPSRAQRLARKGDLFYQLVRPYQKNNYLFDKSFNDYVFSTGYAQIRPYEDENFLFSLVQNDLFVRLVLDRCTGTSYPAISSKDLSNINIPIPSLPEQEKIGNFFKKLDERIILQEKKIEKLENMKKAYLSEMFV